MAKITKTKQKDIPARDTAINQKLLGISQLVLAVFEQRKYMAQDYEVSVDYERQEVVINCKGYNDRLGDTLLNSINAITEISNSNYWIKVKTTESKSDLGYTYKEVKPFVVIWL